MAHLFQVGAGSGGMVVLDLLTRDERIDRITLIEPDCYQTHNVYRHYFPPAAVGQPKGELARTWIRERRPDLDVDWFQVDLLDPAAQSQLVQVAACADFGICAVDNEPAKFHFDALFRQVGKPWTLGEVLSGGIGGWVHALVPGGACYGCIASHLQREIPTDSAPSPNYADPNAGVAETRIPASKAAIDAIASLHAILSLQFLEENASPGFTSVLMTLQRVEGVFEEAFKTYRFAIPRLAGCLVCQTTSAAKQPQGEELDVAVDEALARLGHG